MFACRSFEFSWLRVFIVASIGLTSLVANGSAAAAERLVPVPVAGAPDEGIRLDDPVPASRHGEDVYVFAATRSLRESGIQPVVAVALVPATLAVDAVFFPFALALEQITTWR